MKNIIVFLATFFTFCQALAQVEVTLETPYNTIYTHLYYLQSDSYQPDEAAKSIYGISDSLRARRIAIQLKQILDGKGLMVYPSLLPQDPDYVDSTSQNSIYILFPGDLPEVYVEKIDGRWYYSPNTIELVPGLHKTVYPFGSDRLLNILPRLGQNKLLGLAIWQYLAIAFLLLVAFLIYQILSRLLNPVVKRFSQSRLNPDLVSIDLIHTIARLISVLVVVRLIHLFLPVLQLPVGAVRFLTIMLGAITVVLVVYLGLRILDVVMLYAGNITSKTESKLDEQLIPIIRRTLQIMIIIGGIVQILYLLEINVTALIAGISIGGLALALAAQDTVKNLIGSAMIFVDQPFQIGDYITGGGIAGTVVEVGFRTTRLRQVDSSILAVPNGTIANAAITNLGVREFRLFQTTLGVVYDTPPERIEDFVKELRNLIEAHPNTIKDNYYVYVSELGASAINIMFRCSLEINDYRMELALKEGLILSILKLAEEMEISFAFPSTSVYLEKK